MGIQIQISSVYLKGVASAKYIPFCYTQKNMINIRALSVVRDDLDASGLLALYNFSETGKVSLGRSTLQLINKYAETSYDVPDFSHTAVCYVDPRTLWLTDPFLGASYDTMNNYVSDWDINCKKWTLDDTGAPLLKTSSMAVISRNGMNKLTLDDKGTFYGFKAWAGYNLAQSVSCQRALVPEQKNPDDIDESDTSEVGLVSFREDEYPLTIPRWIFESGTVSQSRQGVSWSASNRHTSINRCVMPQAYAYTNIEDYFDDDLSLSELSNDTMHVYVGSAMDWGDGGTTGFDSGKKNEGWLLFWSTGNSGTKQLLTSEAPIISCYGKGTSFSSVYEAQENSSANTDYHTLCLGEQQVIESAVEAALLYGLSGLAAAPDSLYGDNYVPDFYANTYVLLAHIDLSGASLSFEGSVLHISDYENTSGLVCTKHAIYGAICDEGETGTDLDVYVYGGGKLTMSPKSPLLGSSTSSTTELAAYALASPNSYIGESGLYSYTQGSPCLNGSNSGHFLYGVKVVGSGVPLALVSDDDVDDYGDQVDSNVFGYLGWTNSSDLCSGHWDPVLCGYQNPSASLTPVVYGFAPNGLELPKYPEFTITRLNAVSDGSLGWKWSVTKSTLKKSDQATKGTNT